MTISNYPNGFVGGVSIKEIPVDMRLNDQANVYWVSSTHPSTSNLNPGTFTQPFATLAYAATRLTASKGDVIYLAPGHAEAIATASAVTIAAAGATVVFLGEGSTRATLTVNGVVGASILLSGANIKLVNPRFVAGLDALTGPISITGAKCELLGGEWNDGTTIDTTNCIVAAATATGLVIDGWRYLAGNEAGTQKQSHIQLNGVDNAVLRDIDIAGNFATGNIQNVTDEVLNARFERIRLKNTNATPKPGLVLDADSTGQAKDVDIRIVSGTTYVSSLAKFNWDHNCLGYNSDGTGGDPLGTAAPVGIEGKIDAIQADLGDPSARTNHQSVEAMIGVPDAVNSNLDDMLRTGFDSTAIARNVDGSVMERLEDVKQDLSGASGIAAFPAAAAPANGVSVAAVLRAVYNLSLASTSLTFTGSCDAGMVASTTALVSAELAGYGDDFFNTKYYIQVIKNSNAVGTAPETEVRQVTDYVSATGTFTTVAFSVNVETTDELLVLHESLVVLGRDDANNTIDTSAVVANGNGSLLERDQFNQDAIAVIDGYHDVPAADAVTNAQVRDVVGNKTDAAAAGAVSATESLMAYAKQTVTEGIARDAAIAVIDGFHDVPGADVVTNAQMRDVIGNKTDAAAAGAVSATESIMAYAKQTVTEGIARDAAIAVIDGFHDVPAADAVTNAQVRDVVGNKTDAAAVGAVSATESIMAYAKQNVTVAGDPSAHTLTTITAKLGNGTTAVAPSLGEPDGVTTESIHGKLGTDTQFADRSVFDILVGDGPAVFPASAAPANDVSLAEVLSAVYDDTATISDVTLNGVGVVAGSVATYLACGAGGPLGTQLASGKSIIDAIGSNGTTLSYGAGSALGAAGTEFWVSKVVDAVDITVATPTDLTGISSGGYLAVEDVIVRTDGTGLATSTNINIISNSIYGAAIIWSEVIANLGANATVDLDAASVRGVRTVIDNGKKLQIQATGLDATGGAVNFIHIKFRRLSSGATIAAA